MQAASKFFLSRYPREPIYRLMPSADHRARRTAAIVAVLCCTLAGTVAAKAMLMPISWVEACYFAVSTITTVGYGDYNPMRGTRHHPHVHNLFLAFHMLYIVIGVSVITTAITLLLESQLHSPTRARSLPRTVACAACNFAALVVLGALVMGAFEGWELMRAAYWAVVTLSTVNRGAATPLAPTRSRNGAP